MIKTVEALKRKIKRDIAYWEVRVEKNPDRRHKLKLQQLMNIKKWIVEEGM